MAAVLLPAAAAELAGQPSLTPPALPGVPLPQAPAAPSPALPDLAGDAELLALLRGWADAHAPAAPQPDAPEA
ncbi:MAG: hypothetical protein LC623_08835, partial [Halobacteriales archaeon]|nr:hypothetical protein [Halobacteriales archaeon]